MLVDHICRYCGADFPGWTLVGRLAFPCFAVSLAVQVSVESRLRVAARLLVAAALVFPIEWYVTGHAVVSVLATLAFGLIVADVVAWGVLWERIVVVVSLLLLSTISEFGPGGVLLVAGLSLFCQRIEPDFSVCAGLGGCVYLVWVGGPSVGIALSVVGLFCLSGGFVVPRLKGWFLKLYFLQWLGIAAYLRFA